jgi:CO/xanthine dehydrogenase FAD-binding subunit
VETRDGKLAGRAAVGCAHQRPVCLALDFAGARDFAGVAVHTDAIADAFAADLAEPDTDWIASGGYRLTLARVLLARQLTALARR